MKATPENSEETPLVSVVTPVLDGERYIARTLQSVKSQSFSNIEHIVVDGGSTDGTREIVRGFGGPRTKWVSAHGSGQPQAINRGMSIARGDILTWLNCDDLLFPDAAETVVTALRDDPRAQFTYAHSELIDKDGKVTKSLYTCRQTADSYRADTGNIFQGTVFFTREAWEHCGPLDESLKCAFEYKLFDEFFRRYRGAFINRKLAQYRIHSESISSRFPERFFTEMETFRGPADTSVIRNLYRARRIIMNLLDGNLVRKNLNR